MFGHHIAKLGSAWVIARNIAGTGAAANPNLDVGLVESWTLGPGLTEDSFLAVAEIARLLKLNQQTAGK